MTLVHDPETGDWVDTETGEKVERFDDIDPREAVLEDAARGVRAELDKLADTAHSVVESSIAIGRHLAAARALFPADREYGHWFEDQAFGFSVGWGRTLMLAAENEAEFRDAVVSQLTTGKSKKPNVQKAVRAALGKPEPEKKPDPLAQARKEWHGIRRNVELAVMKQENEYRISCSVLLAIFDALGVES